MDEDHNVTTLNCQVNGYYTFHMYYIILLEYPEYRHTVSIFIILVDVVINTNLHTLNLFRFTPNCFPCYSAWKLNINFVRKSALQSVRKELKELKPS